LDYQSNVQLVILHHGCRAGVQETVPRKALVQTDPAGLRQDTLFQIRNQITGSETPFPQLCVFMDDGVGEKRSHSGDESKAMPVVAQ